MYNISIDIMLIPVDFDSFPSTLKRKISYDVCIAFIMTMLCIGVVHNSILDFLKFSFSL